MRRQRFVFSGVHAGTGSYLRPPLELTVPAPPPRRGAVRVWGPREGVDARDLGQAGWGVVFPEGAGRRLRRALAPLLERRREQAGELYRELVYRRGETAQTFLYRHGVGPGPVDPRRLPYYLTLVGGPVGIPYHVQYHLDVQYAVGRLGLATPAEVRAYARGVVGAETGGGGAGTAAFFAPSHPGDELTDLSAHRLAQPLAERLREEYPEWRVRTLLGAEAGKEALGRLLGGADTPALLFTAGHGLAFWPGDPRQRRQQGALLCHGWPGPGTPPGADYAFSGDDVAAGARLRGLICFHFACYSAGAPRLDAFSPLLAGKDETVAPRPFVAHLPRRLLGHPEGGALAVVGHVDTAWLESFLWGEAGAQLQTFESALARLLRGFPVGHAMGFFGERYAELVSYLDRPPDGAAPGRRAREPEPVDLRLAAADARSFVVLGDPAVRLGAAS